MSFWFVSQHCEGYLIPIWKSQKLLMSDDIVNLFACKQENVHVSGLASFLLKCKHH